MNEKKIDSKNLNFLKLINANNSISNKQEINRLDKFKKKKNQFLKKHNTLSNLNNIKTPFNFTMKITKNTKAKIKENNISSNYLSSKIKISKTLNKNSFSKSKKKNNSKKNLKNTLIKEEYNKEKYLKEKEKKKKIIEKKIPINKKINLNINTNNITNYSSSASNDKKNNFQKENEDKEKQSEFLNYELGYFKNLFDFSINNNFNDDNIEEKEINLEELCSLYQKKNKISILENNFSNEQSFYCFDINEMNDGERIQRIYNGKYIINN